MKKTLSVALMLLIAGIAYATIPANSTPTKPTHTKRVTCVVKGKTKIVKTVDACKALGGTVAEAKKAEAKRVS